MSQKKVFFNIFSKEFFMKTPVTFVLQVSCDGSEGQIRTNDLPGMNRLLYPLSYSAVSTSAVQLSYYISKVYCCQ